MKPSADKSPARLEFEPFLFAEIGTEENGMVLTVASVFARLGLDPWHQAAVLARLPEASAAASLASAIGRLQAADRFPALSIAGRLIPLLPKESDQAAVPRAVDERAGRRGVAVWWFWAALVAVAAYMVWF